MAGSRKRINRASVSALQRGDWLTDNTLPGFKVRRPNRHALYGLNIRLNGRMRWYSIGSELDLTPDQARAEAERLRGLKRQGFDPTADRDKRKSSPTMEKAAARFMAEHVRPKLRARTVVHYEEILGGLIIPRFGTWRVISITESDVSEWHGSLARTPIRANRALGILSSLMTWTVGGKMRPDNPCGRVARYREQPVNRYPTATDLTHIMWALDDLLLEKAINPFFAAGVKVMIMTGARRSEIFEAQWPWLDVERRCLTLPDSKTGAKVIALPGRAGVGLWRLHDLRHGFASAAVSAGAPLYVVGKQLGHSRPSTTGRYSHVADEPKHAVAETVAQLVTAVRSRAHVGS